MTAFSFTVTQKITVEQRYNLTAFSVSSETEKCWNTTLFLRLF